MDGEALFQSTHAALVFAYNFAGQAAPPILYRLGQVQAAVQGKGLSGVDGAAQAGFIRYEVARLGKVEEALIIGRIAPSGFPCSCGRACCSGKTKNFERADAVALLADYVKDEALAGCATDYVTRRDYVEAYFGRNGGRNDKVCDKTEQRHKKRIGGVLKHFESEAQRKIDEALKAAGMVA